MLRDCDLKRPKAVGFGRHVYTTVKAYNSEFEVDMKSTS